ncbi:MAG: class I SAM-dependent methyltransferase [Thermotogota bacterium]|nr:class I SAM-dependent methyltransferase [Thermotogota bacterium]
MNKEKYFKKYSEEHIHFYDLEIPDLLRKAIKSKNSRDFSLVDLGCGDGRLLFSLQERELLSNAEKIVGVDLSHERIENLKENVKNTIGIISDTCNVKDLKNETFDVVISSQVIEHVSDDNELLKEIGRLLKSDGIAYISTVVKKWYGFYIYRNNGRVILDPTHVREYSSKEEFLDLLERNGLKTLEYKVNRIKYPLLDLIIRIFIKTGLIKPSDARNAYMGSKQMSLIRKLTKPIIGYYNIEVLCEGARG